MRNGETEETELRRGDYVYLKDKRECGTVRSVGKDSGVLVYLDKGQTVGTTKPNCVKRNRAN